MILCELIFQTIVSDMNPPPPHVVNIDVNSGTVTVETPQETDFLTNVNVSVRNLPVKSISFFSLSVIFVN